VSTFPASASAQVSEVRGWIGDVPRVGPTFRRRISIDHEEGTQVFVARPTGADPDRVVLHLLGPGPEGSTESVASSSGTCVDPFVRSVFGPRATCLIVDLPRSGSYVLLSRPLLAPASGNLRADFYRISPVRFTSLGRSQLVMARRADLGTGSGLTPGSRELVTVEVPGGLPVSSLWVEGLVVTGVRPLRLRWEVAAMSGTTTRYGLMGMVREADWFSSDTPHVPRIWVEGGTLLSSAPGRMRVVRNDAARADADGDGAGAGLEAAARTCDSASDVLRFIAGFDPRGGVRTHEFACAELVRDGVLGRLQDTDQDGLTDAEEYFGREGLGGPVVRWGAEVHQKDLLVEVDLKDYEGNLSDGVCPDASSRSLWNATVRGVVGGSTVRQLASSDYAAPLSWLPDTARPLHRAPVPEWQNPDGTSGVRLRMDLGPPPASLAPPTAPSIRPTAGAS